MALLASCWLLIESLIIPYGFLKWFYLSFYIHPIFLTFCQIFLWLIELHKLALLLFTFPLKITYYVNLFIFKLLINKLAIFFSYLTKTTKVEAFFDAMDQEFQDFPTTILQDCEVNIISCNNSTTCSPQSRLFVTKYERKIVSNLLTHEAKHVTPQHSTYNNSWLNEFLSSDHYSESLFSCSPLNQDQGVDFELQNHDIDSMNTYSRPHEGKSGFVTLSVLNVLPSSINQELTQEYGEFDITFSQGDNFSPISDFDADISLFTTEDDCYTLLANDLLVDHEYLPPICSSNSPTRDFMDPFHQKYLERMGFFYALYQERLYGMNAILKESSTDMSMQYNLNNKMAKKRLLRSLECDFELIYVAQLCLLWEALHHQYQKVESLIDNSENTLFHHNVSGKFQELQILLVRFVEDQKCEGQIHLSFIHKRVSFQGQLQVPDITGFIEQENNMEGEGVRGTQVLKAIDKCIKAFWLYVKKDNKKSMWRFKGILRTHPPVEDPQDLELLYSVTKAWHKKGVMLKDLQGKKKCWLRTKVRPLQTQQHDNVNLVFAMIDMEMVQRLLKMPLISKSHLNWCQQKLHNLDLRQGQVFRSPTSHLFPSS